jgi:hypothetical protein
MRYVFGFVCVSVITFNKHRCCKLNGRTGICFASNITFKKHRCRRLKDENWYLFSVKNDIQKAMVLWTERWEVVFILPGTITFYKQWCCKLKDGDWHLYFESNITFNKHWWCKTYNFRINVGNVEVVYILCYLLFSMFKLNSSLLLN